MMPTTPSTHSSNSGPSPDAQFRVVRKRNRIPLSCGPCRHRKLKCDRSSPCQNCVRRAEAPSCVYATPSSRKRASQVRPQVSVDTADDMQNRIDRLEGLVLSLMTNGPHSVGPTAASAAVLSAGGSSRSGAQHVEGGEEAQLLDDRVGEVPGGDSDTENVTKSFGIMKVDNENKKTVYLGEGHWAAVLNDIAEVRNYFQTHKNQFEEQMHRVAQTRKDLNEDSGPALLFGASKPPPRAEILSQLPSRYLTDILVARYFNTFDPATHVLHGPLFQKHYEAHWADPSKTSVVWVAMLFAILRIALLSYECDGDEPPEFAGKSLDLSNTYRAAMANCLILADYTKPHQYIIETLIFHLHAEYRRNRDSEASVWVLVGMIVRLAMRMGYHRDSKMFPNITPFQGEMRRRVWTYVRQADLLFSFQISLPAMIRIGDSDTDLPRNLYDEEFDEDTSELPPSRPISEPTTVSLMITRARLAFGFGRVLEEVNGVRAKPYEEILKIDKGLRDVLEAVPEHLKLRPMQEQYRLPVMHIIARFHIATIYHKSQCVLHRRFLRAARNNPRYVYSRRTCLESAMALLGLQSTMHRETSETGRLRSRKSWFTSLAAHDFLLAATIICMDLYLERERADANTASTATSPRTTFSDSNSGGSGSVSEAYGSTMGMEHSQEDLLKALEESRDIWAGLRDESMEAYKASEILNLLLAQLRAPVDSVDGMIDEPQYRARGQTGVPGQVDEKQNAAMTLGLLSSGGKSSNDGVASRQPPNQTGSGSIFEQASSIQGLLQATGPTAIPNGGVFDTQSAVNGPLPFLGMFSAGATADMGGGMNLDWDAFDTYIQSSNLSLDPANTLWPSLTPNSNPLPTNMSTMEAPSNINTGTASSYFAPQNVSAYESNASAQPSTNARQEQDVPLDSPMQEPVAVNNDEPGQALNGVPMSQLGGFPTWKWNSVSAKQG